MEEFISKGYLYADWNGKFTVKEGVVMRNWWCGQNEAAFRYGNKDGEWVRCSVEPGKLVAAKLWLPKRDDKLARETLIKYHEESIDKLLRSVASHEEKLYRLKNA